MQTYIYIYIYILLPVKALTQVLMGGLFFFFLKLF